MVLNYSFELNERQRFIVFKALHAFDEHVELGSKDEQDVRELRDLVYSADLSVINKMPEALH